MLFVRHFHGFLPLAKLIVFFVRAVVTCAERAQTSTPYRRCIMSFLISPIAFAGLRFFGQVLVQFMMVWQR